MITLIKHHYVTFQWKRTNGTLSNPYAIRCPNEESMYSCAQAIRKLRDTESVKTYYRASFPSHFTVIDWKDYVSGKYVRL